MFTNLFKLTLIAFVGAAAAQSTPCNMHFENVDSKTICGWYHSDTGEKTECFGEMSIALSLQKVKQTPAGECGAVLAESVVSTPTGQTYFLTAAHRYLTTFQARPESNRTIMEVNAAFRREDYQTECDQPI